MSRLAVGTVQFGLAYGIANRQGQVSRSAAKHIVNLASASGVDTLDTAIAYGESETCLGEVGSTAFKIITKLPEIPDGCNDVDVWVQQQLSCSLTRLNVAKVYGLLVHRSEQLLGTHGQALYSALQRLKEVGRIEKVGVSIYSPVELSALSSRYHFDLVQAPMNLVDRRFAMSGWLHRLEEKGIEVHTRSAFLQGLLLMPKAEIPRKFEPWSYLWNRWHGWLESTEFSAVQACLAYPLSFPGVDRVVVGVDSVSQFEQIVSAERSVPVDLPDLSCAAEDLINPARWPSL